MTERSQHFKSGAMMPEAALPGAPSACKFYLEDKIVHNKVVGVVTRVGCEVNVPGRGPARRVWFIVPGKPEAWAWDFELEAW